MTLEEQIAHERDAALEQIERLAKDRSDLLRQVFDKNHRIAQLEAALRRIATVERGAECTVGCDQIARAALDTVNETADAIAKERGFAQERFGLK